jgi:hypothetical protein
LEWNDVSFAQRLITVTVQLATNTQTNQPNSFSESGTDTVALSGSRTSVRVENSGSPVDGQAQVKIWGMTPSLMNQLATLGLVLNLVPKNTLTISAGQLVNGVPQMATIFTGTIWAAYGDYEAMPDVPFIFECRSGGADSVISAPASSFPGSADVATMMSGFARQMNLGFENNGVNLQLTNAYFTGSNMVQARKCAESAGISWGIGGNTLAIWPKGSNRNTPSVPTISKNTGMVGYPAFTQQGIIVKTLFNPLISFGSLVKVQSSLLSSIATAQAAQQSQQTFPTQWAVNKLDLALDSFLPKGQWLSTIYGYNPGYAKTIIPGPSGT